MSANDSFADIDLIFYSPFSKLKIMKRLAVFLSAALLVSSCDAPDMKETDEKFDIDSLSFAPEGRREILSHVVGEQVLVLRSAEGEQISPDDTWSGIGENSLTEAASRCSGGLVIVEPGNNEAEFNFWQVIVPSNSSAFGSPFGDKEFARCVSKQSRFCFTIERHDDALRLELLSDSSKRIEPKEPVETTECRSSDS